MTTIGPQSEFCFGEVIHPKAVTRRELDLGRIDSVCQEEILFTLPTIIPTNKHANISGTSQKAIGCAFSELECRQESCVTYLRKVKLAMPNGVVMCEDNEISLIIETMQYARLQEHPNFRWDATTSWKWQYQAPQHIETLNPGREVLGLVWKRPGLTRNYTHWLWDILPMAWALVNQNRWQCDKFITQSFPSGSYQDMSLNLLGITSDKRLEPPGRALLEVNDVVCGCFSFQSSERLRGMDPTKRFYRGLSKCYASDIRKRAHERAGTTALNFSPPEKIYVSRRDATHRKVLNEKEIEYHLDRWGFAIVCPGEYSFFEQIMIFSQAKVIIGLHGAGLSNLLWAGEGCTVIEIAPRDLTDAITRLSAHCCGHNYRAVLAERKPHPKGAEWANVYVNVKDVEAAITSSPNPGFSSGSKTSETSQ